MWPVLLNSLCVFEKNMHYSVINFLVTRAIIEVFYFFTDYFVCSELMRIGLIYFYDCGFVIVSLNIPPTLLSLFSPPGNPVKHILDLLFISFTFLSLFSAFSIFLTVFIVVSFLICLTD